MVSKYKDHDSDKCECLECGRPLVYASRLDQKFCCEKCRYTYNNRKKTNRIKSKTKIEHILQKNYTILCKILKMHTDSYMLCEALAMGFNINYMTSIVKYSTYTEYTCYDVIYRISATKLFKIRRMSLNL